MQQEKILKWSLLILFCCGGILLAVSVFLVVPGHYGGFFGEQQGPAGGKIQITSKDVRNQTPLEGVAYYINGKPAGTSAKDGTLVFSAADFPSGIVSILAVKEGYQDTTIAADLSKNRPLELDLHVSDIFPILVNGPPDTKIDIVFIPSNTSFNSSTNTKVLFTEYPGGKQKFEADAREFINQTFDTYPSIMTRDSVVSGNYVQKFNFYYFWDGESFGDAFNGCAGKIPDSFWQEVTYSDLTILLYPGYYGMYLGPPSQPMGCTNPNGLGNVYLKIPADQPYLAMHEIGHGLYGLVDTYCGNTYYLQNNPNPNVWSLPETCRRDAASQGWDPDNCRQIALGGGACIKDFWHWDPDPDIMKEGYYGRFGNASTMHILSVLNRY
ncbi:MAG: M64 family metallopeptidase [Methanoregula sp.]|nr:M64 family metallopeptidase [Methanoregula sp.]